VKNCKGKYIAIYADAEKTISIANPMLADSDGSYRFYSRSRCVKVTVE
jgi:hypothetical protein